MAMTSTSDETAGYSLEDILQLIEGLEAGAGSQTELLECAVRIGHIADQVKNLNDASFESFVRFMVRMTQSAVNPGSPGYPVGNQQMQTILQVLESLVQMALDLLFRRDQRFTVLAMHLIRVLTDRNASVYNTFDHRRVTEAESESAPVPQNYWAVQLRRNSFCIWLDPEGTYQATKVTCLSHHRPLIELQSLRFGILLTEKAVPVMSPYLFSLDSKAPEPLEEWRQALAIGSKVDCIDHIAKWYTAQIVGIQQQEGLVQVAYDGWAPAYNEWLPRASARIQPHLSVAVGGRSSSGVEILYPEEWLLNDSKDCDDLYTMYRGPIMGGDLLPHVVSHLAEADGFGFLCKRIQVATHASLEEIRSVAFILRNTAPLLSKAYANEIIGEVSKILFDRILDLNDVEMRPLSKEFLSEFVMIIRTPLLRVCPKNVIARRLDEFELSMALKRFRCPIVERQLNGMEFLHDTMHICKGRDAYNRSSPSGADCGWAAYRWQWLDSKAFIQWMDQNGVWDDAFGEHAHSQLMKRASELLRFICSERQMTTDHLDLIWNAIQRSMRWQDECTTQILYTVLDEIAFDLSDDHVAHLLQLVSGIDLNDYVVHTLDMIRRLHRGDSTSLNLIWKAMQEGSSELAKEARIRLEKMLQLPSQSAGPIKRPSMVLSENYPSSETTILNHRIKFVVLASKNISERVNVIQNLRFVQNVALSLRDKAADSMHYRNAWVKDTSSLSSAALSVGGYISNTSLTSMGAASTSDNFIVRKATSNIDSGNGTPGDPSDQSDFPSVSSTRAELLDWLVSNCHLIVSIFDELVAFVGIAEELVQAKETDDRLESLDKEDFHQTGCSFMENLSIRLQFLKFVLSESSACLSNAQIDILWDVLFVRALCSLQKDLAFQWFQEIIEDLNPSAYNSKKCTPEAINYFFTVKLCSLKSSEISQAAYACIEHCFFRVNLANGKVSGPPYHLISTEPDGINFIWKILLGTSNRKVSSATIAFLNQLFCGRRLDYLTDIMRRMTDFISCSDFARIRRLLRLISHLLTDCTDSNVKGFSHSRTLPGLNCEDSSISFRVTFSGIPTFMIVQPSHTSLHWLRKTIATKVNAAEVHHVRMFLNGAELSLLEDDRSIGEICVPFRSSCDAITPKKKRQKRQVLGAHGSFTLRNQQAHTFHLMASIKRSSATDWNWNPSRLLASSNALNPTAYSAVCRFFHAFSKGSSVLNPQQLKNFLSLSNVAKVVCPEGPNNVKMFLNDYASGSCNFTLANCVSLYTMAANRCADLFWQDIQKLCTQDLEQAIVGFQSINELEHGSARDILSSSPDYFATLFQALELGDNRISGQVWRLLMSLPTNPSLRQKILELDKLTSESDFAELSSSYWESVFDMKSAFRLMYSLQIIQSSISNEDWTDMDIDVMTGLFDENTDDEEDDNGDASDSASTSSKSSQAGNHSVAAICPDECLPNPDAAAKCTDWSTVFIRAGGFRHLYSVFLTAPALDGNDDVSLFCLALLLKSVLALAKAAELMVRSESAGVESIQVQFEKQFPWLQFEDILDRVMKLALRISSSDMARSAWSSTCAIYFDLQLLKWISVTVSEMFCLRLQSPDVLSTLYVPLVCNVRAIREQMQSALYVICQQREELHMLILDFLLSQLCVVEHAPSGQFFGLLKKLLLERFASSPVLPEKYESLVDRFVQALRVHVSIEQPGTLSSPMTDELLLGIIDILTVLCSAHQSLCDRAGQIGVIEILLNDCLYGVGTDELPKCRSLQTRRAAFACVSLLCAHSQDNLGRALHCLYVICTPETPEMAEQACVRRGWEYEPEKVVRSPCGYTGLVNQGTTCYMNALVSQLFMIPALRNGLIEAVCCDDPPPSDTIRNHRILLHQLQVMLANMATSSCAAFDTSEFCGSYTDESGAPIDVRVQQDAQEFFNVLVDRIELALKGSKHETLLKDVFGGRLCNQMLCQGGCGSVRERFEDFSNVSLQVKGFKTLSESLEAYVASEKLSGVECDACGVRTETTLKRVVLDNLPQTLIFHLKRFELNFETFMNEKLNGRFEFPFRINMEPYTKQALSPPSATPKTMSNALEYDLVGVIIHIGTADAGHYFSYIKDRSSPGNIWLEFNDQIVRKFSVDKLGEEAFGGDDNMKNAYMLVYDRIADNEQSKCSMSELKIPPALVREISEHNKLFFRDRQLFDTLSLNFIREILSLPARPHEQIASKLSARFNLEIIPRSVAGFNDCCLALSALTSYANIDFNLSVWLLKEFGTRLVLLNDLLLACRDKSIRETFAELLSTCLEKVSVHDTPPISSEQTPPPYSESVYDEPGTDDDGYFHNLAIPQTLSQEVVALLLKLVDSCSRHWLRFQQLFSVILRWANSGVYARQFLISQAAVARLGHLVLGRDTMLHHFPKHSTVMGNRIVQPDLRAVYAIMGILVRSCYGANMSRPASSLPGPLSMLSQEDLQIVNAELFYDRALAMGGDIQGIVDILAHRSWENPPHVAPINKMIIDGIIKATAEQVKPYFDLFHGIVQIPDSLQIIRIRELMSPENGILFHLRSFSSGHPAFTFISIRLLIRSMVACEPLSQHLSSMRQHCDWMIPWMQRYYDQHSYQLNANPSLTSGNHASDSTTSCLTAIDLLRRHLQVPFSSSPGDDAENAISLSSSDADSSPEDLNDDALPTTYSYQDQDRNTSREAYQVRRIPSRPLNSISGLEGEEQRDLSDLDQMSSDNDTSSVRSSGSVKKRRTGADIDRLDDDTAEASLSALDR